MMPHESKNKRIILASASPRRHHLLRELGYDFEVITTDVEESYPQDLGPEEVSTYLAKLKADSFGDHIVEDMIVITADTVVSHTGRILEKPNDRQEAISMLQSLSDDSHEVYSGLCVRSGDTERLLSECTKVHFRALEKEEIEYYVDHYKPWDKAGAYGIQEWIGYIGIDSIEGSYFNVMGLPVDKLYQELKKIQ